VVGKFDNGVKVTISDDIIYAGFVTDDERNIILSNAKILINPSKYESLSLSILESMIARTPILVNGNCDVLKGQCIRSNAGLYYTNYMEFEYGLNFILNNEEAYREMCENGYKFVKENYDWDTVVENVTSLIYEINYEPKENN
jgi:glycosyltransferase involved in cell wall biosynthesis